MSGAIHDCWNRIGVWGDGSCGELAARTHCRNCPVYSKAAMDLLDRDLADGQLDEWTELVAAERTAAESEQRAVLVFRVGAEWLALPVGVFEEVVETAPVHSVPHRRGGALVGLANVRGELVLCVSLAKALGVAAGGGEVEPARTGLSRLLVANRNGSRFAFEVDEVLGVHRFAPEDLAGVPATLAGGTAALTRGLVRIGDRTAGCLDDERLFAALDARLS